ALEEGNDESSRVGLLHVERLKLSERGRNGTLFAFPTPSEQRPTRPVRRKQQARSKLCFFALQSKEGRCVQSRTSSRLQFTARFSWHKTRASVKRLMATFVQMVDLSPTIGRRMARMLRVDG